MLVRRVARVVGAVALAAVPAVVATAVPAEARPSYDLRVTSTFSPNGDGVQDTASVRYTVPKPTHVHLEVARAGRHKPRVVRTVDLGWKKRGTYAWTWDGRNDAGNRVHDGLWSIAIRVPSGLGTAGDRTRVDTRFSPTLTTPAYGLAEPRARVFPRSADVVDAVDLTAFSDEDRVSSLRVVVRDARGVVVRDADADEAVSNNVGVRYGWGATVPWEARRGGRALPQGRYTAVATGRDAAGNEGTSDPIRVWVSSERLVWKEVTTTLAAADAQRFGRCTYAPGPGCSDFPPCGEVVPSTLFADGLSYRSRPCADPTSAQSEATTSQLLEVPEATGVRGLSAVRVAFAGAPTAAGEPDAGTLVVSGAGDGSTVTGTSGQSTWVTDPTWGEGLVGDPDLGVPDRAPAAVWTFTTTGTDSVDVASFTVDVRYLVVAD